MKYLKPPDRWDEETITKESNAIFALRLEFIAHRWESEPGGINTSLREAALRIRRQGEATS